MVPYMPTILCFPVNYWKVLHLLRYQHTYCGNFEIYTGLLQNDGIPGFPSTFGQMNHGTSAQLSRTVYIFTHVPQLFECAKILIF